MVYTDKQWASFYELIGQPDRCKTDPRLASIAERTRNIDDLYREVSDALKTHTTAYWTEALGKADIPVMQLHTLESLMHDPHLEAVGYFRKVEHPTEGAMIEMPPIGLWSDSVPEIRTPAPGLGEHTESILKGGKSPWRTDPAS